MKAYILDRNCVVNIRNHINKKPHDTTAIKELRKLDLKSNFIICLVSFMEGNVGIIPTGQNIINTINEDSYFIKLFFKSAKTDSSHIEEYKKEFAEIRDIHFDKKNEKEGVAALQKIQNSIPARIDKNDALDVLQKIKTSTPEIVRYPYVYFITIAAIFGNGFARKTIKPCNPSSFRTAYNAWFDIQALIEFLSLKNYFTVEYQERVIEFVSFDKGQKKFLETLEKCTEQAISNRDKNIIRFKTKDYLDDLPFLKNANDIREKLFLELQDIQQTLD